MSNYRNNLPQLGGRPFLTDGGIETTLIFHEKLDLPYFAAFYLLKTKEGTAVLRNYFTAYAELAKQNQVGLILESPTWRASQEWGDLLGYSSPMLERVNHDSIALLEQIRQQYDKSTVPVVISGCLGPRGDGYIPDQLLSADAAEHYHQVQIDTLADTTADMICALTLSCTEEAIGITRAARNSAMPVAISFTVETDGKLPTGQTLQEAIARVDDATDRYPIYYMINCAHPSHFEHQLCEGKPWVQRIRGIRANASSHSHAELNEANGLDMGNPVELGQHYRQLKLCLPQLNVLGGCCGTDTRHIEQIAEACLSLFNHPS